MTLQPALRANKPTFSEEMEIKFKKQPKKKLKEKYIRRTSLYLDL